MARASSVPPRVSLQGETLKLIYITGRQREGARRKNTFICVNEKMKQEGCESLSQPRKLTGPDKRVLFLTGPGVEHFSPTGTRVLPKQKKPRGENRVSALIGGLHSGLVRWEELSGLATFWFLFT